MLFCSGLTHSVLNHIDGVMEGGIQDFKLGGYLKKLRRPEGGAKICGLFHRQPDTGRQVASFAHIILRVSLSSYTLKLCS